MAEVGGRARGPVAAQVDGVDPVARRIERGGEPRVAGAVLGEAVRDLDDRLGAPVRQPAPPQEPHAVLGAKDELAPRHSSPSASLAAPVANAASWSFDSCGESYRDRVPRRVNLRRRRPPAVSPAK